MSRKRTILVSVGSLAAGALMATSITGLALAADGGAGTPSSGASTPAKPGAQAPGDHAPADRGPGRDRGPGGDRGPGPGGPLRAMMGPGQMLHSETVVKAEDGSFLTVAAISGTVTAVSASSITVKAEDGYSATYVVNADTKVKSADTNVIGDIAVGDKAQVTGSVKGGVKTADRIHSGDLPKIGDGPLGRHLGKALGGQHAGGGADAAAPAPAPKASTPAA